MADEVQSGDPLRIQARTWNDMAQAADAFRRGFTGPQGAGRPSSVLQPTLEILAYRDPDDDDLDEFQPVVLRFEDGEDPGPLDPAANPLGYQRRPVVYALSPEVGDADRSVGITQEPIPAGGIGRVATAGVTPATVTVVDASHEFAVLGTSAATLTSAAAGPARILWKQKADAVGDLFCLVELGVGGTGSGPGILVDLVHVVGGPDWPDVKDDVFAVRVERLEGLGLVESTPRVVYGNGVVDGVDTGVLREHANLPFRCADPDDPAAIPTHQIALYRDRGATLCYVVEWPAWGGIASLSIPTAWTITEVGCAITAVPTLTSYDWDLSFNDSPYLALTIRPTP